MLVIEEFLSEEQLDELLELLDKARYVDGSITAGY
ncbi:MAG TPA: PKHD-type hydroxylase, partial [Chromatiales bacterium]|nr:PKHD-type hydroxylase [Chromatiales bacterium]